MEPAKDKVATEAVTSVRRALNLIPKDGLCSVHARCLSQSLWPSVFSYHFCKTRRLCQRASRLKVFPGCVDLWGPGSDPQALPSCFPHLFPSTTVCRHRALSQGGCFFEFTVRQDIEGLMWPRNWRVKPLTWIKIGKLICNMVQAGRKWGMSSGSQTKELEISRLDGMRKNLKIGDDSPNHAY